MMGREISKPGGELFADAANEKLGPRQRRNEARHEVKHKARHERTTEKLISKMIGQYVGIEEKRAVFLRDGADAWRVYRERGLRVTSHEVLSWIGLWNAEDESEGPRCHE